MSMSVPGTCGYVIFDGRRAIKEGIELRLLKWEDYPELLGGLLKSQGSF